MRRGLLFVFLLGALFALIPSAALAAGGNKYCVPSTSIPNCPSGGTAKATIAAALTASSSAGGHNAIYLGPQTFSEPSLDDQSGNSVDIIGDGEGKTILTTPTSGGTVLEIAEPTSTVSNLTLTVPTGSDGGGLAMVDGGSASQISVNAASGATDPVGVDEGTSALKNSSIVLGSDGTGVEGGESGDFGSVVDSSITAGTGVEGASTIARDRITANVGVNATAAIYASSPRIDDTLIRTTGPSSSEVAVELPGATLGGSSAALLEHDTLIGDGSSGSTGLSVVAGAGFVETNTLSATVTSTIIRGYARAIYRSAEAGENYLHLAETVTANVSIDYSDFNAASDVDGGNTDNTGTASGSITTGTHDVNVDPGFASTTPSAVDAFQLTTPSPVIDKGEPSLASGESTTDLAGDPRVVAGRVGGTPRSDIGAFEYQPTKPKVVALASPTQTTTGGTVKFTATVTPVNPGDTTSTPTWKFDDGATASGASVTHAFSKAGTHTGTVTVKDLNGFSVSVPVTVKVTAKTEAKPKTSGSAFSGLARGRPRLHVKITRGSGSSKLSLVTVGLPGGLSFSKKAISHRVCTGKGKHRKCKTVLRVKGLSHPGETLKSVKLNGGKLTVTLKKAVGTVSLTFSGPLLRETKALRSKVKKHKEKTAVVSLKIKDTKGKSFTPKLKLKLH